MSPIQANRLSTTILANAHNYDEAVVWSAKRTKFNFWSMLVAAIGCIIMFIAFAWGLGCLSKAVLMYQNNTPFFFNIPGLFLLADATAFFMSVFFFFQTGNTSSADGILLANARPRRMPSAR